VAQSEGGACRPGLAPARLAAPAPPPAPQAAHPPTIPNQRNHVISPQRPYGVAGLLATYDEDGPALYLVEPSGIAHKYHGTAVGKARQAVKNELEKMKLGQLTCKEAVVEAAKMCVDGWAGGRVRGGCQLWVAALSVERTL